MKALKIVQFEKPEITKDEDMSRIDEIARNQQSLQDNFLTVAAAIGSLESMVNNIEKYLQTGVK